MKRSIANLVKLFWFSLVMLFWSIPETFCIAFSKNKKVTRFGFWLVENWICAFYPETNREQLREYLKKTK